ncbi:MAG: DapH/DapD/GlmU-related protein [Hyphomonadaceae bacterium]
MSGAAAKNCVRDFVERAATTALAEHAQRAPWEWTQNAESIVRALMAELGPDYRLIDNAAIHGSAVIEIGAIIKGPAIIGPECYLGANSYVRGGCWLDARCTLGPSAELKSSFLFAGARLARLNFVGDSVLGADVSVEAGAVIANYRTEWAEKRIRFRRNGALIETGAEKFGALVGDGACIGANAVIAPGAILERGAVTPRLALVDQS